MKQSMIQAFYEVWSNSKEYRTQSALENVTYENCTNKIKKVVGESVYDEVDEKVIEFAYEAELAGFENGLRYGIMFINGMLKGGVYDE